MRKIKPKSDKVMTGSIGGSMKSEKMPPIYPTFRIGLEHLPEAKNWKVGKEYSIEMKVKMIGISQSRFQNDAEFEIKEIGTEDEAAETDDEESSETKADGEGASDKGEY